MKIGIFYFSATGVTDLVHKRMKDALLSSGYEVDSFNIILMGKREKNYDFSHYYAVIFGFPVYSGRLPNVAELWLDTLHAEGIPTGMFFTYGARLLEKANQITYTLLTKAGFIVVLSAEFIGKHTFNAGKGWIVAANRPNDEDYMVADEYIKVFLNKIHQKDTKKRLFSIFLDDFEYNVPKRRLDGAQISKFHPKRVEIECSMCRSCEDECPTGAFDAISGSVNPEYCITCLHCLSICPDKVIQIGDLSESFTNFMKKWNLSNEIILQKKSRIYDTFP